MIEVFLVSLCLKTVVAAFMMALILVKIQNLKIIKYPYIAALLQCLVVFGAHSGIQT